MVPNLNSHLMHSSLHFHSKILLIIFFFLPKDLFGNNLNNCTVTDDIVYVCGPNGKTFSNPSIARCEGVTKYTLGKCGRGNYYSYSLHAYSPDVSYSNYLRSDSKGNRRGYDYFLYNSGCLPIYEVFYVCGSDGKTYTNPSLAHCAGIASFAIGQCQNFFIPQSFTKIQNTPRIEKNLVVSNPLTPPNSIVIPGENPTKIPIVVTQNQKHLENQINAISSSSFEAIKEIPNFSSSVMNNNSTSLKNSSSSLSISAIPSFLGVPVTSTSKTSENQTTNSSNSTSMEKLVTKTTETPNHNSAAKER